jgi:hypothetical protein
LAVKTLGTGRNEKWKMRNDIWKILVKIIGELSLEI